MLTVKGKDLSHVTYDEIFKGDLTDNEIALLNDYLKAFALPVDICPRCEAKLSGIMGTFTWSIAHGEGSCGKCGWPLRAYHCNLPNDQPLEKFTLVLAYHPDFVEIKGKE